MKKPLVRCQGRECWVGCDRLNDLFELLIGFPAVEFASVGWGAIASMTRSRYCH